MSNHSATNKHPTANERTSANKRLKVMLVFGTRPEAVKMAPVARALQARPDRFETIVTVTAQHRELLDQTLQHFELTPDYDLDLMRAGQSLTYITQTVLTGLEPILAETKPDLVLVHGDTTTTFAAALAAYYQHIPVGHVEAGLRTGDKYRPWPEEMNRRLAGVIADLHFAPTAVAKKNLLEEGVPADRIWVTGNTAIDALLWSVRPEYEFRDPHWRDLIAGLDPDRPLVLVDSLHRRENLGEAMDAIYEALARLAALCPNADFLVALHKNPQARAAALKWLGKGPNLYVGESLDYPDWVNLMAKARLVISDSGGIQEEAPALGVPVLVLRDVTERPEAVAAGTVRLIGTDPGTLAAATKELLEDDAAHADMAKAANPYGDGHAAERIADAIWETL